MLIKSPSAVYDGSYTLRVRMTSYPHLPYRPHTLTYTVTSDGSWGKSIRNLDKQALRLPTFRPIRYSSSKKMTNRPVHKAKTPYSVKRIGSLMRA